MITNEEKAKEISGICSFCLTTNTKRCAPCTMLSSYTASLRMARWKDEQFANERQALIEKMDSILDEAEAMRETAIGRQQTGGWYWRKWAEWGYRKAIEVMEETK